MSCLLDKLVHPSIYITTDINVNIILYNNMEFIDAAWNTHSMVINPLSIRNMITLYMEEVDPDE